MESDKHYNDSHTFVCWETLERKAPTLRRKRMDKIFKCSNCEKILAEFRDTFGNINIPCMCDVWEKEIIEIKQGATTAGNDTLR